MLRIASIAFVGATLMAGAASAQIALPTSPPVSPSDGVQHGAVVSAGSTQSGNPAVGVVGGKQAPVNATVSQDGTTPTSGAAVYARTTKQENGVPVGVDLRVSATPTGTPAGVTPPLYQGVQVGRQ